jgi:maltose-binding protein MalE
MEVIDGFKELYPNVQFEVSYFPFDDLQGRYSDAVVRGDGPTLLIGPSEWGPALFDGNVIADLSQLADQELLDSINSAALAQLKYKQALIGLPEAFRRGVVMFRNKDIIPDSPHTLRELIEIATQANQGEVIGADFDLGFYFSGAQLAACDGKLLDENGDPAFNNAAGLCWINLLRSFKDSGLLVEYNTDNDNNLFKANRLGLLIDGSENIANLVEAIGEENLSIDPWPTTEHGYLSGFVETEAIYLNPKVSADTSQVAWYFMEYFLSPEAQAILADPSKAAHLPTVKDVKIPDRLMKETVIAFERSTPLPIIPEMIAYWSSMEAAIHSIIFEEIDPTIALQQAYNKIIKDIAVVRTKGK